MYELRLERHFLSSAKKLDGKIKNELEEKITFLEKDPYHPRLHLKPLHGSLRGFHSFRIGKYRVIIEFLKNKKIRVLEIDKRDKVYK